MSKEIQFLLYSLPDEEGKVQVVIKDETLWCTQKAMALLFGVQRPAITKHLGNIFREGELDEKVVCSILETVVVLSNSPSSKICPKCLLIAGTPTPKSCAIAFWVHQSVSSLTTTCTLPSSSGRLYNRNCISLLIVCLMITSYTNILSKHADLICFSFSKRWVWRVIWRSRLVK